MKRFSTLVLCLVGVYAMAAVVAGGVYANGTPKAKPAACKEKLAEKKGKLLGKEEEQQERIEELKEEGKSKETIEAVKKKYEETDEAFKKGIEEASETCNVEAVKCKEEIAEAKGNLDGKKEAQKLKLEEEKKEGKSRPRLAEQKARFKKADEAVKKRISEKKASCKR